MRHLLQYGDRGERAPPLHRKPPVMTTNQRCFIVQIVGIDDEGQGPRFYSEAEANEYAAQAIANGWKAVITSYSY